MGEAYENNEKEELWKSCSQLARDAYLRTNASAGMPIRDAASYCEQEEQRSAFNADLCGSSLKGVGARASPDCYNSTYTLGG